MVKKSYNWEGGATLDEHSKVKLKILDEYFCEYLRVRCVLPQQEKFRLVVVDGFCGAGLYGCGAFGSPLVLMSALQKTERELNLCRAVDGFKPIRIECQFEFNDTDKNAVALLQENIAPLIADIKENSPNLLISCIFTVGEFEVQQEQICNRIVSSKIRNVLFNLDQYGYSNVSEATIKKLISITRSSEIFLTFAIASFLAFVSPERRHQKFSLNNVPFTGQVSDITAQLSKPNWLGAVEGVVFEALCNTAKYVSPFSIHNPNGWRYWLIHIANSYRARQVYNDILHKNKSSQAHFGRSGLNMLKYSPDEEASLYLFKPEDRQIARTQLLDDIPRFVDKQNERHIKVGAFYEHTYNGTPAHSDDIHTAIIDNPDLEVVTPKGGTRRKPNMIKEGDVLRLRPQRTLFSQANFGT